MNKKKFNDLYENYSQRLYGYIMWLTKNKQAAEDVTQATFIKIWKQDSVPSGENELESWLYTVARNATIDFFRKCARFTNFRLKYSHEMNTIEEEGEEPFSQNVWEVLDQCNEKEKSILYLHFKKGHTFKEVAHIMDMKESAVRVSSMRALEKLRKKCGKDLV